MACCRLSQSRCEKWFACTSCTLVPAHWVALSYMTTSVCVTWLCAWYDVCITYRTPPGWLKGFLSPRVCSIHNITCPRQDSVSGQVIDEWFTLRLLGSGWVLMLSWLWPRVTSHYPCGYSHVQGVTPAGWQIRGFSPTCYISNDLCSNQSIHWGVLRRAQISERKHVHKGRQ